MEEKSLERNYRLNAVLTNGQELVTTRFISNDKLQPHSLYYSVLQDGVIVASERLTDNHSEWTEVPKNHALLINKQLCVITHPLKCLDTEVNSKF